MDERIGCLFAQAFRAVAAQLATLWRRFDQDGALVVAVRDGLTLAAHLHVVADERARYIVIGSHPRCDLQLSGQHAAVDSRHLLVAVQSVAYRHLRVRLWDLGTGCGFLLENGVPCHGLASDGVTLICVGHYHLFFIPTGELATVPLTGIAEMDWEALPSRVYRDERLSPGGARAPYSRAVDWRPGDTPPTSTILPAARGLRGRRGWPSDERWVGTLRLIAKYESLEYPLDLQDVAHGVLVGRLERCHLEAPDPTVSRVHALIVGDEGHVVAIDTASTNGLVVEKTQVRVARLDGTGGVRAAGLRIEWRPCA